MLQLLDMGMPVLSIRITRVSIFPPKNKLLKIRVSVYTKCDNSDEPLARHQRVLFRAVLPRHHPTPRLHLPNRQQSCVFLPSRLSTCPPMLTSSSQHSWHTNTSSTSFQAPISHRAPPRFIQTSIASGTILACSIIILASLVFSSNLIWSP